MPVRRLKDDAVLDHPVRTFISGLLGTVNGAEKALAEFDQMARKALEQELLLLRFRELAIGLDAPTNSMARKA